MRPTVLSISPPPNMNISTSLFFSIYRSYEGIAEIPSSLKQIFFPPLSLFSSFFSPTKGWSLDPPPFWALLSPSPCMVFFFCRLFFSRQCPFLNSSLTLCVNPPFQVFISGVVLSSVFMEPPTFPSPLFLSSSKCFLLP